MDLNIILSLVTIVITIICGFISKKFPKFNNNLIPIQNILIGLIVASIEWIITKDFSLSVALSGIFAGGTYDIINNIKKLKYNKVTNNLEGDDSE